MDSVGEYDDDGTGPLEAFLIGAELFFSSTPIEANESDSKLESASFAHNIDQIRARVAAKQDGFIGQWSEWMHVKEKS